MVEKGVNELIGPLAPGSWMKPEANTVGKVNYYLPRLMAILDKH